MAPKIEIDSTKTNKSVATTRSTGGAGYDFEDKVGAWFIVKMMSGAPLPGIDLPGVQFQSQTSALGWKIDDICIVAQSLNSKRQLAVSCKSNVQVSGNGLPADFVMDAWDQLQNSGAGPFNSEDKIALVTRGRHAVFSAIWSDIKDWSSGDDNTLAVARIRQSRRHSKVFENIKNAIVSEGKITDFEVIGLIQHLLVIPTDFQLNPSMDENAAIAQCRELLSDGTIDSAKSIWAHFLEISKEIRIRKGSLNLENIIASTRSKFQLKIHPDFNASWRHLKELSEAYASSIQTCLPNGYSLEREEETDALVASVSDFDISVVIGESGCGKSSLVKSSLVKHFHDWNTVWLGAEQLSSFAPAPNNKEQNVQISCDLAELLEHTNICKNILVIDAAEKLDSYSEQLLIGLLDVLITKTDVTSESAWKFILTSQMQGLEQKLSKIIKQRKIGINSISNLKDFEVRSSINSVPNLGWLAQRQEYLSILRNFKTLAWTIEASTVFKIEDQSMNSMAAVSDKIWSYWTSSKISLQNILIKLAEREANFERSFALSDLENTDVIIIEEAPSQYPVKENSFRRLEFEHDLAADWARYQKLKELSGDLEALSRLSINPRWNKAFRLLGQFLLRQSQDEVCLWDKTLIELEERRNFVTADLLLEALCFDPQAGLLLEDRADFFLGGNGKWLNRLLKRFVHVATLPNELAKLLRQKSELAIYFDNAHRSPTYYLWPPFGNFLHNHKDVVASFISPTVSKFCKVWLSSTPVTFSDGTPMVLRKEMAELALMNARELQISTGSSVIHMDDNEGLIYQAALLSASDAKAEACEWVLEMAGRKEVSKVVVGRISHNRLVARQKKAEKLKTDPKFRASQEKLKQMSKSSPRFISSSHDLPPWELGPQRRVDNRFRKCCLDSGGLTSLMTTAPDVASEVLLALMIEDNPVEEYSSHSMRESFGLSYGSSDSYPTIYWKSSFYQFLKINSKVALSCYIKLINFCVDRWEEDVLKRGAKKAPYIAININSKKSNTYLGNYNLFLGGQQSSLSSGLFYSALDALEKWLCEQSDAGINLDPVISELLINCRSVSVIGVLVNLGKYAPGLFITSLRPILMIEHIYWWDKGRVDNINNSFDMMSWSRTGEASFNLARDWTLAPHRKKDLTITICDLIWRNTEFSNFIKKAMKTWEPPQDTKQNIEYRQLCALLDRSNYKKAIDPETDEPSYSITYPNKLLLDIQLFHDSKKKQISGLYIPYQCDEWLESGNSLSNEQAQNLYELLLSQSTDSEDEDNKNSVNRVAIASTLAICAMEWLRDNHDARENVSDILEKVVSSVATTAKQVRSARINHGDGEFKYAAYGVTAFWLDKNNANHDWEYCLLTLLSSGNKSAANVIGWLSFKNRDELGGSFWRIIELGTLWSALTMLRPDFVDEKTDTVRWDKWLKSFRSMQIRTIERDISNINISTLWRRLDRVKRIMWRKSVERRHTTYVRYDPKKRPSPSLDTDFFDGFLQWLVSEGSGFPDQDDGDYRNLISQLWDYEISYLIDHAEEGGELRLPYPFGYTLIGKQADLAVHGNLEDSVSILKEVFALGPNAHHIVEYFANKWFHLSSQSKPPRLYFEKWRKIMEYVLEADWSCEGIWYRREGIIRCAFGFGNEAFLSSLPNVQERLFEFKALYSQWVQKHFSVGEDNLTNFSYFLAHEVGAKLRLDGVIWIAEHLNNKEKKPYWREDRSGKAMLELLNTIMVKDLADIKTRIESRDAVLSIAAHLVEKRVETALSLQDNISSLL
ncbi:MAG: nSTAND1 domain-containing NTPase [Alphaproteobacteria bacterium]